MGERTDRFGGEERRPGVRGHDCVDRGGSEGRGGGGGEGGEEGGGGGEEGGIGDVVERCCAATVTVWYGLWWSGVVRRMECSGSGVATMPELSSHVRLSL